MSATGSNDSDIIIAVTYKSKPIISSSSTAYVTLTANIGYASLTNQTLTFSHRVNVSNPLNETSVFY